MRGKGEDGVKRTEGIRSDETGGGGERIGGVEE